MARRLLLMGMAALLLVPASVYSLGLGEIRLDSFLNQPLNAEIPITLAPGDELATLKVGVASREAFERFGLDRPDFLSDLRFRVEPRPGGQAVLHVSSTRPIREPFVTFLVQAEHAGGRILREYTVLLDPPVFAEGRSETLPAAPVTPAPAEGAIARPAPAQPAPPPAVAPSRRAAPREVGTYGPVRRNETLWGIAQAVRPSPDVTMNQAMMALYQANPDAFDDNINRLRAGATLRVPTRQEMLALTASRASAEVRSQNRAWRGEIRPAGETPAPGAAPGPRPAAAQAPEERLELVPPAQAPAPAAGAGPAARADYIAEQEALNEELLSAIQGLRRELEDTRQLITVKDAEIAALQDRISGLEGQPAPGPAAGPAAEAPAAGPTAEAPAAEAPVARAPQPAAQPEPAPATPPPAVISTPAEEGGLPGSPWLWVLVVIAAGGAAWAIIRRRREAPAEESYEAWTPATAAGAGAGAAMAAAAAREEEESIVVEEREAPPATRPARRPEPRPVAVEPEEEEAPAEEGAEEKGYRYPFEDTIAGATGINLEQSDPLAEADFHMAYGLYDQAADLVAKAIEREPDRADLRMKMLDILFVWGRGDEFLEQAGAFKDLGADSSDWRRVVIMGRQICPGESLFEDASVATGAERETAEDSGEGVDFEVGERRGDDGLDFELEATGERPGPKAGPKPDETAELEIEDLGLDMDLDEDARGTRATARDTGLTERVERADEDEEASAPETGLTEILEREEEEAEDTGLTAMLRRPEQEEDEETASTETEILHGGAPVSESETQEMPALEEEPGEPVGEVEEDDTAEVRALEEQDAGELELDDLTRALSADLDSTAEMRSPEDEEAPDSDTLMHEIFGDEAETRIAPGSGAPGRDEDSTKEMPTPPDVTLSEVGTKLDLARAYVDMGDPAGARTILEEVLKEGDEDQKKEARQLIEGLD